MPDSVRLSILRSTDDLLALRPAWSDLWRRDPDATPFQSPEWLIPWWHHFSEGELRVLTICRAGQLTGILSCYIYRSPAQGPRKLLPVGVSTSDYIDGSFAPECSIADIAAALQLLLADADWNEWWFPQLRPESKLSAAFRLQNAGCYEHEAESTSRINAGPLSGIPRKLERNIANYRNRARREGKLELVPSDSANWNSAFDTLCSLHSRRWHQAGKPGVLADPRVLAWHREAIPALLAAGIGRLTSLRLNGDTIAVLYSLLDPPHRPARTQYCYLNGVSPDYPEFSPGTLLLALTIEQASAENIPIVDLLRGDEPYKNLWHPSRLKLRAFSCARS